ncbi:MAG TPA: hypothetical protein VEG28_04410, partial [Dehalococcoidia bacterium]|nr:hypothetical protein [Dehalococcoidia bacterium]
MVTSNNNTAESLVGKFRKVKNGLDEGQVLSTIKALVERNANLTDRFSHLDALTKLAQSTVIQAEQEAATIKKEAELAANSRADGIIASAEEQAKSKGDSIIAESRRKAEESANAILTSAQRQAEDSTK